MQVARWLRCCQRDRVPPSRPSRLPFNVMALDRGCTWSHLGSREENLRAQAVPSSSSIKTLVGEAQGSCLIELFG